MERKVKQGKGNKGRPGDGCPSEEGKIRMRTRVRVRVSEREP